MKAFMYRVRDAMTATFKRVWSGFWRGVWAVHAFDFWDWVYRQAHPDYEPFPFSSGDRYNRGGYYPLDITDEIRW